MQDVEYGIEAWFDYLQHTAAAPQFHPLGDTLEERIAWVNESGRRRDRHAGGRHQQDRRAVQAVQRRLRLLPDDGPRVGPARRRRPPLRAVRPARDAASSRARPTARWPPSATPSSRWDDLNTKQADALAAWTDKHAKERANKS